MAHLMSGEAKEQRWFVIGKGGGAGKLGLCWGLWSKMVGGRYESGSVCRSFFSTLRDGPDEQTSIFIN